MDILFKAKRKDTEEWVEGLLLKDSNGACYITVYDFYPPIKGRESRITVPVTCDCKDEWVLCVDVPVFEVDPNTVCQYIKQKDKYGKPIFENDIVTIENTKKQGLPGAVVYNRTSASFELARDGYNSIRLDYFEDGKTEFVVVGNIFDKEEEK